MPGNNDRGQEATGGETAEHGVECAEDEHAEAESTGADRAQQETVPSQVGASYDEADHQPDANGRSTDADGQRSTDADEPTDSTDLDDPAYYLNRELSELAFQRRVLAEARDERKPLLERVRFLGLLTQNIDEFSRKRVGGLKRRVLEGETEPSPDGRTPAEQWRESLATVGELLESQAACYASELQPALSSAGIEILEYDAVPEDDRQVLREHFESSILPILTPLTFDPAHPFPHISNLSLSLAVLTRSEPDGEPTFSRVKIPGNRSRLVQVAPDEQRYVLLEDVIAGNLDLLFPQVEILGAWRFRVTRNAEVRRDETADDLVDMVEDVLEQRRFATVVRLDVDPEMPERARTLLREELELEPHEVLAVEGPLKYGDFTELVELDRPDLKHDEWTPQPHPSLPSNPDPDEFFAAIREQDVLVHHPYHSFRETVQQFFELAAIDPKVLAIKAAIYRTEEDSAVAGALVDAVRNGKQAAANVELKARFDEERNLKWVNRLEEEGVHVSYGTLGLKTHTKTGLIVREEDDGVRLYSHIGTGNYHSETAKSYEDLGLLTADRAIGRDVSKLCNFFTGHSLHHEYEKLLVAPTNMKTRILELIRSEADRAREGEDARLVAKINRLEHPEVIKALYAASQAGVDIDLLVRDICCLRPGIEGVSDTINVYSIVGRFLEHSRIYYFRNGGDERFFVGSADWMIRNLENRVEAVAPVTDPDLQATLREILNLNLSDNWLRWELQPDGTYRQRTPEGEERRNTHEELMRRAREDGSS